MHATGDPNAWYLLTNAHCGNFVNGYTFTTGAGSALGTSDFVQYLYSPSTSYDLAVIRIGSSDKSGNRFYTTGSYGSQGVGGYAAGGIIMNATYCISGVGSWKNGKTTPNCNLYSVAQFQDCQNYPGGKCVWLIAFKTTDGSTSSCHGDSGGPIYYYSSNGAAIAAGVQTSNYPYDPTSNTSPGSSSCYMWSGVSVVATAVNTIPGLAINN